VEIIKFIHLLLMELLLFQLLVVLNSSSRLFSSSWRWWWRRLRSSPSGQVLEVEQVVIENQNVLVLQDVGQLLL
jgi:hypothetical protein